MLFLALVDSKEFIDIVRIVRIAAGSVFSCLFLIALYFAVRGLLKGRKIGKLESVNSEVNGLLERLREWRDLK